MNYFKHLLWALMTLILILFVFRMYNQYMDFKLADLQTKQDYYSWQQKTYKTDLVKFCQQTSATTTNASWQYKNCLKALNGIIPTSKD